MCVYFSDKLLNMWAQKTEMSVFLLNKFQKLTFSVIGANKFKKFSSSQRYKLINGIFNEEFDIETMKSAGVILDHFALHKTEKNAIIKSWKQHKFAILGDMLTLHKQKHNFQTLTMIANYYGENMGLYFAFAASHIAWLIPLSIVGLAFQAYHIWSAFAHIESDESWLQSYRRSIDNVYNFFYIIFVLIWATVYTENWKRKTNLFSFYWGISEDDQDEQDGRRQ